MEVQNKVLFAFIILVSGLLLLVNGLNYEEASLEEEDIIDDAKKGETATVPTRRRVTSARAYVDDRNKREGFRYYGTGSKSGNSFAPTSIQKSTSPLDTLNYFVTSKANRNKVKDLEAAGSGMSSHADGNNYLTVYDTPAQESAGGAGAGAGNYMMMGNNAGNGMGMGNNGMAMEEAFGDMMSETGNGGGYGWGSGSGGKGCNSALGLLGVLGLAAYLQNVLRNMQNVTGGRRKRDVGFQDPFDPESSLDRVRNGIAHLDLSLLPLNETSEEMKLDKETYNKVMQDVFPLLSAVAHARDGFIPIHCTHSSVCLANQVLVRDLGSFGHTIGNRLSSAIAKLLSIITKDERAEQIRMILKAGKMGRNRRNCLKVFPTCNRLKRLPIYNIPTTAVGSNNEKHLSTQPPVS